ncbi:MAG: hypothetical protein ABFS12_01850 [Bacteroidota bacterium]
MDILKIIIAGFLFAVIVSCSSSEMVVSNSVDKDIVIDGNHEEWSGKLKYYEDKRVALGFQNDDKNLYLCLVSSNRAIAMKIMTFGLTVWFEPENEVSSMGLRYPIRNENVTSQRLMGTKRDNQQYSDFELKVDAMMQTQSEFNLIDENEEIIFAAPIISNNGFEIKISSVNQQFVYEARVPIGDNNLAQIPLNIYPNERIAIRLETGEVDMDKMRESGEMNQTGMGKGSGGNKSGRSRGDGMHGSRRGSSSQIGSERLDFEVEVKLSQ